jgi:ketosteroid isomerase-like protein
MNKSIAALKYFVAIGALVFAFFGPIQAQPADETAKTRILTIQKEWADARVTADIAYLEHLYAKEFRVQDINGAVASREDDIAMFREGRIKPQFVRDEAMDVSIYGIVAVVTGIENVGGTYGEGPLKGQYAGFSIRFTNVFVQRDGRWQLVLHQGTQILPKK